MIEKQIDNAQSSAELMDSLRQRYDGDRKKAIEECPFSESAIAYAFEELAPDALQTIEAHLQSCSACMDLVLDARTAGIESQAQAESPPMILPALSDAVNQPRKSSWFEKLAANTFTTIRIIAAPVAVVCFMLIIAKLDVLDSVHYELNKKETVEWPRGVTKQITPVPASKKKRSKLSTTGSQTTPSAVSSFSASEGWSIDPFEPALSDPPRRATKHRAKPRSPLAALDLNQLKLVGVMLSDQGNKALVEDASGKGYVIRQGAYIGMNAGKVSQILKDRVIIEEKIKDVHGNMKTRKRIIKLNKP